jgi:hypothetical protein
MRSKAEEKSDISRFECVVRGVKIVLYRDTIQAQLRRGREN